MRTYLVLRMNWLRTEDDRSVAKDWEYGFLDGLIGSYTFDFCIIYFFI